MARVIIIKVDKFDWNDPDRGISTNTMVHTTGGGLRRTKSYISPRHAFVHYNPSIGPIFRSFKSEPYTGSADYHFEVDANRSSPMLLDYLKDVWVTFGENAHLRCEITGNPKPTIKWYKDGKELHRSYRIWCHYEGKVAELTINSASSTDAGWYSCRAENALGKRETNCRLYINDQQRPASRNYRSMYDFRPMYQPENTYLNTYYFKNYSFISKASWYSKVYRQRRLRRELYYLNLSEY